MKAQIIDIISKAANLDTETVSNLIEIPPKADRRMGNRNGNRRRA